MIFHPKLYGNGSSRISDKKGMCLIQTYKMNMISSSSSAHSVLPVDVNNQSLMYYVTWHNSVLQTLNLFRPDPVYGVCSYILYIHYRKCKINCSVPSWFSILFFVCLDFKTSGFFFSWLTFKEMLYINCQYVFKFKTDAYFSIAFEIFYWSVWCLNYDKEIIF